MGWNTYRASRERNEFDYTGKMNKIKLISNRFYNWTKYCEDDPRQVLCSSYVVKAKMVGAIYYAVIETWDKENGLQRHGQVVVTRQSGYVYLSTYEMHENDGPGYYQFPKKFLKLLTPTTNEHALTWRRKCMEYWDAPKRKISRLKVGTKITFKNPYSNIRSGHKVGDPIQLEKISSTQWHVIGSAYNWAQSIIPEYFTIDYAA